MRTTSRRVGFGMGVLPVLALASGLGGCGLTDGGAIGETGYLGGGGASAIGAGGASQGKGGSSVGKGGSSVGQGGTSQGKGGGSTEGFGGFGPQGQGGTSPGKGGSNPTQGQGGTNPTQGQGGTNPTQGQGGTNPTQGQGGTNPTQGQGGFTTQGQGGTNTTQGQGGFVQGQGGFTTQGQGGFLQGQGGFTTQGEGGFGPGFGGFGPGFGGFGPEGFGGFGPQGFGGFGPEGFGGFGPQGFGGFGPQGAGGEFVGTGGSLVAGGTGQGGTGQGGDGAGGDGAGGAVTVGQGGAGGSGPTCGQDPDADVDGDGWTPNQGDCNDCDPNVNPGAYDVVNFEKGPDGKPTSIPLPAGQQVDEDCSGAATQYGEDVSCDAGLGPDAVSVWDAPRAIGLCNVNTPLDPPDPHDRKWGVLNAKFSDVAGQFLNSPIKQSSKPMNLNYGVLPNFGPPTSPFEGHRILAMSSGQARAPGQAGYDASLESQFDKGYSSNYPTGFPKDGSCGTTGQPHDGVGLDLEIRVPTNAHSFSFQFRFFTYEYPVYVCEVYNDVFAVLMSPNPLAQTDPMYPDIAFEQVGTTKNVIGVNNQSFLTACAQGATQFPYPNCQGEQDLTGSGFTGHGASAWLRNIAPVAPGSTIQLRFAIWDSADGIFDSSVVLDDFRWRVEEGTLQTTQNDGGM